MSSGVEGSSKSCLSVSEDEDTTVRYRAASDGRLFMETVTCRTHLRPWEVALELLCQEHADLLPSI